MAERPSLTADRWMTENGPEFSRIGSQAIGDLQRISRGIFTIGRLLHNSIGDDSYEKTSGSISDLDKQNLAGAIESLADYVYAILEDETFSAAQFEKTRNEAHHE
jgi:hypothetical protein